MQRPCQEGSLLIPGLRNDMSIRPSGFLQHLSAMLKDLHKCVYGWVSEPLATDCHFTKLLTETIAQQKHSLLQAETHLRRPRSPVFQYRSLPSTNAGFCRARPAWGGCPHHILMRRGSAPQCQSGLPLGCWRPGRGCPIVAEHTVLDGRTRMSNTLYLVPCTLYLGP